MQRALGISADGIFGPPDQAGGQGLPGRARARGRRDRRPDHARRARRRRGRRRRRRVEAPARDHDRGPARARHQRRRRVRAQTRRAVKAFQAAHGLEVDGVVGPITLGALGHLRLRRRRWAAAAAAAGAVAAARTQSAQAVRARRRRPGSFDCSGLTQWAMAQVGHHAPAHELPAGERRACTSTARRSRPATSCSSTPTARARRTSASPPARRTAISATTPRRARALDGRPLLGRALLRRAPRRLTRAPTLHQRRQLFAQEREELARLLEPAARRRLGPSAAAPSAIACSQRRSISPRCA